MPLCVDLVGNSVDQGREEDRRRGPARLPDDLHEGELARATNGNSLPSAVCTSAMSMWK
jgi:hypothetical protein